MSGRRNQGDVGRQLQHARGHLRRPACGRRACWRRCDRGSRPRSGSGRRSGAPGARLGIAGHHQNAGETRARGERAEHVLEHGAKQRPALLAPSTPARRCLASARSLTGTTTHRGSSQVDSPSPPGVPRGRYRMPSPGGGRTARGRAGRWMIGAARSSPGCKALIWLAGSARKIASMDDRARWLASTDAPTPTPSGGDVERAHRQRGAHDNEDRLLLLRDRVLDAHR